MQKMAFQRPGPEEYFDYYRAYIDLVPDGDIVQILESQWNETRPSLDSIPTEKQNYRYQDGKWSVAQVIGHLIDAERVFSFRAFAFARGDDQALPGMDQDDYVEKGNHESYEFGDLIHEFDALRRSNLILFSNLEDSAWDRSGVASGHSVTVRALAYIIAGHELHHRAVLRDRYHV